MMLQCPKTSGVEQIPGANPSAFQLYQNYPNPFNPLSVIKYTVGGTRDAGRGASNTRLVVYDVLGRKVATLVDGVQAPGVYEVRFEGSGLASGTYFYRLRVGSFVDTKKLLPDRIGRGRLFSVSMKPCPFSGSKAWARSADEARAILARLRESHARAVVQGHVPGQGVGAFFLHARGEVLAEFMHRRLHEVPYTGGVSSLREAWHHAAILGDALEKLRAARWEGVAMMEYRWDPATDRFTFIEMNARFWGSLHLALYAGVDFPRLLLDAWQGLPVTAPRPRPGVRCRHFPDEVRHVWSKLKAPELGLASKLAAAAGFVALTLVPRVRSDLWFPGDTGLFWTGLGQLQAAARRSLGARMALATAALRPRPA